MPAPRKASVGWVRGSEDLLAALRGIRSVDAQERILLKAVRAACEPILIAAKRFAKRSEQTGALRDSLTIKIAAYRNGEKVTVVGLVGPDRQYRSRGKVVRALGALIAAAGGDLRRPANYAHLVEYGFRIAMGGSLRGKYNLTLVGTGRYSAKGKEIKRWKRGALVQAATGREGGFVPGKPFLRPAVITTRGQQAAAFERGVADGLARELAKLQRAA